MAGRTFEFSTEELELAGVTVDMLANCFAGWCHSAVTFLSFLRVFLFTHTSIYLNPRGRVKRRGISFSQVDFSFGKFLVYLCLTCLSPVYCNQ